MSCATEASSVVEFAELYRSFRPDAIIDSGHSNPWACGAVRWQTIIEELRQRVSGLCLPTYVLDIPGGFGKVPVDADHIGSRTPEGRLVKDRRAPAASIAPRCSICASCGSLLYLTQ